MNNRNKVFALFVRCLVSIFIIWWNIQNNLDILTDYSELFSQGGRLPYSLIIIIALTILFSIFVLAAIWKPKIFIPLNKIRSQFRVIGWFASILLIVGVCYLFFWTIWSNVLSGFYMRGMLLALIILVSAWLTSTSTERLIDWKNLLIIIILFGSVQTSLQAMQMSVDYPFQLYWSEGNRFYDFSLLFGKDLYLYVGEKPLAAEGIAFGRQFLWGLPFLLPKITIQTFRLWNELLFIVPCLILGLLSFLTQKKNKSNLLLWILLGLWSMIFLNQGPIYTPLVLTAILVVLTRKTPIWAGFILVIAAGYYAQISRFTWFPAPAMWAGVIAFVEPTVRPVLERWKRAIILTFGGLLGGYIVPEFLFPLLEGNFSRATTLGNIDVTQVSNMIHHQPLLWERLWPNATYPPGIVLGLVMAAGPLIVLLAYLIMSGRWKLDIWQKLSVLGILLAFLVVGLVVSVKIGGGSNLHNLDMFLVGLLLISALGFESRFEEWFLSLEWPPFPISFLVLAVVSVPAMQGIMQASPLQIPTSEIIDSYLSDTVEEIKQASLNGDVLFIDNRQLMTFQYITDVPLIPEYEKKFMMNKAMGSNAEYFSNFYADLKAQRFSAIVSEPLKTYFQGETFEFGNENDFWVKWVSIPVLCYYDPVITYADVGLEILIPKEPSKFIKGVECP
ncbi:MAG: hypothetical protein JEZ06_16855 [Anaerolineaceae bacterium]|nr:hypothetical protein [Anaerolineaceae bacterium]